MRNLTSNSTLQSWTWLCLLAGVWACGSSAANGNDAQPAAGGAGYVTSNSGGAGDSSGAGAGGAGQMGAGGSGNSQLGVGGLGNATAGGQGSTGVWTYTGTAPFDGDKNFTPLTSGCGPDTKNSCIPCSHANGSGTTAAVVRPPTLLCFAADANKGAVDPTPNDPAAIIEQVVETLNGQSYAHIRITFDPAFVDNSFGTTAIGWSPNRGHTFANDLTKSDHLDLLLTDGKGSTVMELGEDYISALSEGTTTAPPKPGKGPGGPAGTGGAPSTSTTPLPGCGYGTLGVLGGDGYMTTGSADYVIGAATSQARNLNCGYCQSPACGTDSSATGDCTVNSPKTDTQYTANPLTPNWNYDVVYEVWIDLAAFGTAGFGQAYIDYVHASPSKTSTDTVYVAPTSCPPGLGHCAAGQDCWVPSTGDAGGPPPPDGGTGTCLQNEQIYTAPDGSKSCTPIPFANYNNHDACPTGYILDTASEGRYCLRG